MHQTNDIGLLLDPLMHVSEKVKTAVTLNRILVKQRDKIILCLEKERRRKLIEINHMQNQLRHTLRYHSKCEKH